MRNVVCKVIPPSGDFNNYGFYLIEFTSGNFGMEFTFSNVTKSLKDP